MFRKYRSLFNCLVLIMTLTGGARAEDGRAELTVSGGGGSLQINGKGQFSPVFSLSLLVHITDHISAEGGLDLFWNRLLVGPPGAKDVFWDDYLGAEVAVLYHLRPGRESGRWNPFLAAGIGETSTDFTEISGSRYYRLGAGASYLFNEKIGTRFELRDEIIDHLWIHNSPTVHLPSLRLGFIYRF